MKRLQATDALMFKADPEGWRAAHAATNNEATTVLLGYATAGAYLQELGALWDAAYDDYGNPRAALAAEAPKQIGACNAKPPKRTKRLDDDA